MRNKIDKLTEHYLIPSLLAFGCIFLIISVFYWNEWRNVATENFLYPYYPINSADGVAAFLATTSKTGLGYFAITVCCFISVLSKSRLLCILCSSLSLVGFSLLF